MLINTFIREVNYKYTMITGYSVYLIKVGIDAFRELEHELGMKTTANNMTVHGIKVELRNINTDAVEIEWDKAFGISPTKYSYHDIVIGGITVQNAINDFKKNHAASPPLPTPLPSPIYSYQVPSPGNYVVHSYANAGVKLDGAKFTSTPAPAKTCAHSWQKYHGFTDSFDFCTLCNEKRKDV